MIVVLTLWLLPVWQVSRSRGLTAANRFDRENEARKTLAQIIGGVLVLAGLYSSVKTFDLQRQTENVQEQGQINERFTRAIDQLGALVPGAALDKNGTPKINLEVRLGGIYALEQIANDAPEKYHWTVMEVLTAYVRENSRAPEQAAIVRATHEQSEARPRPRADIQAVLDVIGRRDIAHDPPGKHLNLSATHLEGAELSFAHLDRADLSSAHVERADLSGADLSNAHLSRAHLLETDLEGADLKGASLYRAELKGASFIGFGSFGKFGGAANLEGADFMSADLSGSDLLDADLRGVDLQGADLTGAELTGADLSSAKYLDETQLIRTKGSKTTTKLPPGLHPPTTWAP
jgi:uncharacterized protein YjbI with pentapeptide repeats